MTIKCRPVFSLLLAATVMMPAAFCQGLPPTNMGKFVHQPGDNQYQPGSQVGRHGTDGYLDNTGCTDNRAQVRAQQAAQQAAVTPSYTLAPPPPPGPDVSIEAIACEEPVAAPGFPPMPLALDLPVTMGFGTVGHGTWKNDSSGGGGGGGGGSGGGFQGEHEHYGHFSPGAFLKKNNNSGGGDGGGGGGGDDGGGGSGGGGGGGSPPTTTVTSPAVSPGSNGDVQRSGYRVRTPPPIMRTDTFSNQTNTGTTGKGAGSAPTMVAGRGGSGGGPGGKAPTLDDQQDTAGGAPEAPTATGVFQTQSEDLTLPDDEYTSRYFKDGKKNNKMKQYAKQAKSFGRSMLHTTGVPIGF